MFVDFAGHTMEVLDGATGEARQAEVFVSGVPRQIVRDNVRAGSPVPAFTSR